MKAPLAVVFANLKGNIGDFAILHAMLLDLERRFPDHPRHVMAHASLPIDQPRYKAFLEAGVPSFTLSEPVFSRHMPIVRRVHEWGGKIPLVRAAFLRWLDRQAGSDIERFRNYGAVLVAGGQQWNGYLGMTMLASLRAIHRENQHIYGYPFSFHSDSRKFNTRRELIDNFSLLKAPLVVRDSRTKSIFDDLGLDAQYGSDCVFKLRPLGAEVAPRKDRDPRRIILVLTDKNEKLDKQITDFIRQSPGMAGRIALMTTCEHEDGRFFQTLTKRHGIEYLNPLTWQDAVAEMKRSSLIVSNRLHGLILGSFSGVPLLPVVNRSKVAAFAHDIDSPFIFGSIGELTDDILSTALSNKDKILQGIAAFRTANDSRLAAPPGVELRQT